MNRDVSAAYDAIARSYDHIAADDYWMRTLIWERCEHLFQPGDRLLDVGCGTGVDAIQLARMGMYVVAIDGSRGMLDQLGRKVNAAGVADRVEARRLQATDLAELPSGQFDGLISTFAALNTTRDLAQFSRSCARLLRPGGRCLVHMLNRFSLWEWLGLLVTGRWAAARRLGRSQHRDFVIGGYSIRHRLWTADEAYTQAFADQFSLTAAYSLGSLRPPAQPRTIPAPVVTALGWLEGRLRARRPWLQWGRFFVLELQLR